MSSKAQPQNHKKPKQISSSPQFPSPLSYSFEAVLEFARKSQIALISVKNSFSDSSTSMKLPLISPHKIQKRFFVHENGIFVLKREAYLELKKEVESFDFANNHGLYVRGPVGIGKSHLLYMLACEYRIDKKNRVTYVNHCDFWRNNEYYYLLNELLTTFFDDKLVGKSVLDWCKEIIGSDKQEQSLTNFIETLFQYVVQNDLNWIIIFDQLNALHKNPSVFLKFPFTIIGMLAHKYEKNIWIIGSASANNEGYPADMKNWNPRDLIGHCYTDAEFDKWCRYWISDDFDNDGSLLQQVDEAKFWTGGVPYELDILIKQKGNTILEKTKIYIKARVSELIDLHLTFSGKLSEERKSNLKECISRMSLGLFAPLNISGIDKQLFDIVENQNGSELITALNPVARIALLEAHKTGLVTSLRMVAEQVFKDTSYNNATKGLILENYLLTELEILKYFSFKSSKADTNGKFHDNKNIKNIEIQEIIHFPGNKVPLPDNFNKQNTTLFIPKSSNYPGFDFFIWDSHNEVLMGFQLTVLNPFTNHKKISNVMENSKRWMSFCYAGETNKKLEIYWIIPKSCKGEPKNFNENVVFLEDLYNSFPAFEKLVLQ